MELGDPTGDGGGDLEVSSLCLAAFVCLLEIHGCWRELRPHVLPIGLSPARRLNTNRLGKGAKQQRLLVGPKQKYVEDRIPNVGTC